MLSIKKQSAGFSLMEIMIAVAIIGTMAVLIMPNLTKYLGRAKSSATITTLATLKGAMLEYNQDIGHFPTKAEGGINALIQMPKGDKFKQRWQGPYIDGIEIPEDGWNQPFRYNAPAVKYKQYKFYEIYSIGEKGDEDATTNLHAGA